MALRHAVIATFALLLLVAVWTTLARSPDRENQARRYFTTEEIARGQRLSTERRLLFWTYEAAQLGLLYWLAFSGAAARLAAAASRLTGGRYFLTALAVGAVCFAAQEALGFPWSVASHYHQRAWGLTDRAFLPWLVEHLKALAVSGVIGAILLLGLFALMRVLPRHWWLAAALGSGVLAALFAYVLPILIAPIFNTFTPLAQTKDKELEPRVEALAASAGLPIREVLVMDASRQGRYTNAYFTGFGSTRRIVLYDTLLASHTPDETLSILAHEIGHWRRHHIVKGIVLGTLGAFLGFFLLARLLEHVAGAGHFGLRSPGEPAVVPLVLLLAAIAGLLSLPLQNAVSRAFEREADASALELFGHPAVFIDAEKRLARDNVSNVVPSDVSVLLFASHPPVLERIRMAERWRAGGEGAR